MKEVLTRFGWMPHELDRVVIDKRLKPGVSELTTLQMVFTREEIRERFAIPKALLGKGR